MALTISSITRNITGNKRQHFFTVAFDSSYPTGGEALTPEKVGMKKIDFMQVSGKSGYIFEYDYSNEKLKAMYPRSAQIAVVTDKITITASGAANITDGQSCTVASTFRSAVDAAVAAEVDNATDLSGITGVKVMVFGR